MILSDDRLDQVDFRVAGENVDRMGNDSPAAHMLILFRDIPTGAQARASGHDHGSNFHDGLDPAVLAQLFLGLEALLVVHLV